MPRVLGRFDVDGDPTAFGLLNAVTATARDERDPALRWTLEAAGGSVPARLGTAPRRRGIRDAVVPVRAPSARAYRRNGRAVIHAASDVNVTELFALYPAGTVARPVSVAAPPRAAIPPPRTQRMPRPRDPYEMLARAIEGRPGPERLDDAAPRATRGPTLTALRRRRGAAIRLAAGGDAALGCTPYPDGPRPVLVLVK